MSVPAATTDGAGSANTFVPVDVVGLLVADPTDAWAAAGFDVDEDGTCCVGGVRLRLGADGRGLVGWELSAGPDGLVDLDGVPTRVVDLDPPTPGKHPNGVTAIDHVVLLSPDLQRTVAAFAALGVEPRRSRDAEMGGAPIRQVFFLLGGLVLEVVGSPSEIAPGPSSLWGITFVVDDIDAAAAYFGDRTSPVKDAVQPGRRITTLRHRDLGLSVRTALISPR